MLMLTVGRTKDSTACANYVRKFVAVFWKQMKPLDALFNELEVHEWQSVYSAITRYDYCKSRRYFVKNLS